MVKRKKVIWSVSVVLIIIILFFSGIRLNNWIEWKMAVAEMIPLNIQLGLTKVVITPCFPSCYNPSGKALCCGPPIGNCIFAVPKEGGYERTCPLFSDVQGLMAGGMGNNALLSNVAIAKAGLVNSGELIYGGTTNNMSMMSGGENSVLASWGGCYNCLSKVNLKDQIIEKFKFVITSFKN
jgi:hypothetical protein